MPEAERRRYNRGSVILLFSFDRPAGFNAS
jgi:hypothetical protein